MRLPFDLVEDTMEDDIHKSLQLFLAWWKLRLAGEVFTGSLDKQKAVGLNRRLGDVIQVHE